jgi:hypothetical protein
MHAPHSYAAHILLADFADALPHRLDQPTLADVMPLRVLGLCFPFVGRDVDLQKFASVVQAFFLAWREHRGNSDYKKQLVVPCVGGCSGSGKTRFVPEAVRQLPHLCQDDVVFAAVADQCVRRHLVLDVDISSIQAVSSAALAVLLLESYLNGFGVVDRSTVREFVERVRLDKGMEMDVLVQVLTRLEGTANLLVFVRLDEINSDVTFDHITDLVKIIVGSHSKGSHCCLIPVLSGTDIQKMEGATTTSGLSFSTLTLPTLLLEDTVKIVLGVMPELGGLRRVAESFLFNSSGPPRVLQLLLWACAELGAHSRQQAAGAPHTPRTEPADASGPLLGLTLLRGDLVDFFRGAQPPDFSRAFKLAARNMRLSNLFRTFDVLLDNASLVYAHAVTGVAVLLNQCIGPMTVNDWVSRGLFGIECLLPPAGPAVGAATDRFFIVVPFIFLFQMFESPAVTAANPILALVKTPTLKLTPDDAECLDLNIVLSRLWAAFLVGKSSVLLDWLVPAGGMPAISLPLPAAGDGTFCFKEIELDLPGARLQGAHLAATVVQLEEQYGKRPFYAFVNGPKATCCDWFVLFRAEVPATLLCSYPTAQRSAKGGPPASVKPVRGEWFVLAGQTKRYKEKTRLTEEMYWEEYFKTVSIAREFGPFVLALFSSATDFDVVPDGLRSGVFLFCGEDLKALEGPTLARRRARALLQSA